MGTLLTNTLGVSEMNYEIHSFETRHARRVKAYRFIADLLAFAALMTLILLIAVM